MKKEITFMSFRNILVKGHQKDVGCISKPKFLLFIPIHTANISHKDKSTSQTVSVTLPVITVLPHIVHIFFPPNIKGRKGGKHAATEAALKKAGAPK